ncbi:MAG: helix-turn-helix transcriptional regulator [Bacillota bacterium]
MTALTIPDWLHAGITQAQGQAMIVARQAYKLSAVRIDLPLLILPLAGTKRLELGPRREEIAPGQFLMIHHVTCLQVENLPPAGGGESYRAWVIALPWHVVELARTLLQAHAQTAARPGSDPFTIGDIRPLLPMLHNLLTTLGASGTPDTALLDHGLLGVALALARSGHGHFLHACDPSLSARIRLLIAADPAREWSSADFEERLHISGATLRRRLAEENTSLRMLLREARLHHGLSLLQTTRKPVKSVAQACGYRSVPSFTRNFVAHFGIAPSAVANP